MLRSKRFICVKICVVSKCQGCGWPVSWNVMLGYSRKHSYLHQRKLGHSRKHPYHPHGGNRKLTPLPPFGCPNTFAIIRNNFVFPPPPDGRNFLCGGSMDLFWNDPFKVNLPTPLDARNFLRGKGVDLFWNDQLKENTSSQN